MLAGCGKYLENLVRNRLGVKARSVELNVSQRCSASMMSATDQQEAIKAGKFGVQAALNGETGKMESHLSAKKPLTEPTSWNVVLKTSMPSATKKKQFHQSGSQKTDLTSLKPS